MDQHYDDYFDLYFNYQPRPPKPKKVHDPDSEDEPDEDKFIQQDPIEKMWDLNNDKIYISKRLLSRANTQIAKDEEINISYGERANSFLIVEYGFCIPENRYDFYRYKKLEVKDVIQAMN